MGTAAGIPDTPNSTTFEEIEEQLKATEAQALKPDLAKISLDDAELPENLRGKSVQDVISYTKGLEQALRVSEEARQQALTTAQLAARATAEPPQAAAPEPEPMISADEIAEAFQEDPAKGVALMQKANEQAIARAASHFQQRLEPMLAGTASAMEAEARRKYADEFELYKDEISEMLSSMPNRQQIMANSKSWDDMIAYIRGKDPMRLYEHLNKKTADAARNNAVSQQRESVGFQSTGQLRAPAVGGAGVYDPVVDEVCKVMGLTRDEYNKWLKAGQNG